MFRNALSREEAVDGLRHIVTLGHSCFQGTVGDVGSFVVLVGKENFYTLYEVMVQPFNRAGAGPNSSVATIYSAEDREFCPFLLLPVLGLFVVLVYRLRNRCYTICNNNILNVRIYAFLVCWLIPVSLK